MWRCGTSDGAAVTNRDFSSVAARHAGTGSLEPAPPRPNRPTSGRKNRNSRRRPAGRTALRREPARPRDSLCSSVLPQSACWLICSRAAGGYHRSHKGAAQRVGAPAQFTRPGLARSSTADQVTVFGMADPNYNPGFYQTQGTVVIANSHSHQIVATFEPTVSQRRVVGVCAPKPVVFDCEAPNVRRQVSADPE
ncbi:hypothetical protein SBA4_620001 [Candidatus Sulfopaludibacter sp. SbA4]|nr:hypothetical protein SBA4_620001 [Candidatus Sulfopaludibacter sp. SbA4]